MLAYIRRILISLLIELKAKKLRKIGRRLHGLGIDTLTTNILVSKTNDDEHCIVRTIVLGADDR